MTVGVFLVDDLLAYPTEVLLATATRHFITSIDLLDWSVARRTRPILEFTAISKIMEVELRLALTLMPRLPTLEAGRVGT